MRYINPTIIIIIKCANFKTSELSEIMILLINT